MSKLTDEYNRLVLVRDGNDLEDNWIILSEGSGRSCQLFTEREAIYKLLHLPQGLVGRIFSAIVTQKGLVNEHQDQDTPFSTRDGPPVSVDGWIPANDG